MRAVVLASLLVWIGIIGLRVPPVSAEPNTARSDEPIAKRSVAPSVEPSVAPSVEPSAALRTDAAASDDTASRGSAADRQIETDPNPPRPAAVQWQPQWARAETTDAVVIGVSFAVTAGAYALGPGHGVRFNESIAFDERVRDSLRADGEGARSFARDVSDVGVTLAVAQPLVFDAIVNAGWARRSPDVARQLFVMDLSVIALTTAVTTATKAFVGRPRPHVRDCGFGLDDETYDCRDQERELSFYSGHASSSFAMATVTCVQNQYLPLWGSRWAPCAVGFGLAAGTSTLRLVADQHYATDVIAGAVVGTSIGALVPLLHFEGGASDAAVLTEHRIMLLPSLGGAHLLGVF